MHHALLVDEVCRRVNNTHELPACVCVCVLVSRLYNMWGYFIRCCVGPVGQGRVRVRRDGEVDGVAEAVDLGVYGLGDHQTGNDLLGFLAA